MHVSAAPQRAVVCCLRAQLSGEQREYERHGEIHDAVGGCTNDTGDFTAPLQRPVVGIVFLKDTVTRGGACMCDLDCNHGRQ